MTQPLAEQIIEYTHELKLPAIRQHFKQTSIEACDHELTYEQFLGNLLQKEYELRLL